MNTPRPFDDLTKTLQDVFTMPQNERTSPAIKIDLFTRLLEQPIVDRNLLLHDIALSQGMEFETAKTEFLDFESTIKKTRAEKPYKPLPDVKQSKVFQRPAVDPNADTPETIEPLETENVGDLLAREIAPIRWIVEPLLTEGLAILAGPPKIGKSLLCMGLAIAVSTGQRFLNEYVCDQGRVLYLGLEDSDARLQSRLKKMIDAAANENFDLLEKSLVMRKSAEGGIEQIRLWLTEHPDARLVIIDTLARIRKSPGRNANGYLADTDFMAPLQALALTHHVCILLVHHTRKMIAADPLDAVSGTTGIAGVSDEILILKRVARAKAEAILECTGRDIETVEIGISLDEKLRWNYEGQAEDIQKTGERQAIVDFLSEHSPDHFSTSAIALALGKKVPATSFLLGKLLKDGIILSGGYSKYYIQKETL
ncbi:MAG: helicase RepA family protein [Candidatus Aminicenantes bacterium]|nr:helicase RepA family protein [Candidatus Aminicenantes bacterium]